MPLGDLPVITDEQMRERLAQTRDYTLVILYRTPQTSRPESRPVIWEHGRRNMALQACGALPVVCPATDSGDVAGIGIFAVAPDEVRDIMAGDPAVESGILRCEIHPVRGFPGATLPG